MQYFSTNFKLGILGGGQLGKMLLSECAKFDIYTIVLDPSKDAPCSNLASEFFVGDLMDYDTVLNFGKKADLITIEIENVNTDALSKLESEGVQVYPRPKALDIIKNKCIQKHFYRDQKIPTSPFFTFENKAEMKGKLQERDLKVPFVWKKVSNPLLSLLYLSMLHRIKVSTSSRLVLLYNRRMTSYRLCKSLFTFTDIVIISVSPSGDA